jgi:hypothetical protein
MDYEMDEPTPQRLAALNQRILNKINLSKTFVKLKLLVYDVSVSVEIEDADTDPETIKLIRDTVELTYKRFFDDVGRVKKLYAALAYSYPDNKIVISEINRDGSGTTTHFN